MSSREPISTASPSELDIRLSEELVSTLRGNNSYESEAEAIRREEVCALNLLTAVLGVPRRGRAWGEPGRTRAHVSHIREGWGRAASRRDVWRPEPPESVAVGRCALPMMRWE